MTRKLTTNELDLLGRADVFATVAHARDVRKYTGEPYIFHPRRVARMVLEAGLPVEAIAAAFLHDTIEDTETTVHDLRREFGTEVAALVIEVTDVSEPHDGNRAKRKAKDLRHLALASPHGKSIKLADLIDNTASIVTHDPKFAKVYLTEKAALLEVLGDGDPGLMKMARATLAASLAA